MGESLENKMHSSNFTPSTKTRLRSATLSVIFLLSSLAKAEPKVENPEFDKEIHRLVDRFNVSHISIDDFAKLKKEQDVLTLDAREKKEFEISHIPGAKFNGPNKIDPSFLKSTPKEHPIVIYCSVGYRSSRLAEKLQKLGFSNVRNLWGSAFEWGNRGHPLVDNNGNPTTKIHTYDANWSRWVQRGEKVW